LTYYTKKGIVAKKIMEKKWFQVSFYSPLPRTLLVSEVFFCGENEVSDNARGFMPQEAVGHIDLFELSSSGEKINRKELF
jgi:hypothetical protein